MYKIKHKKKIYARLLGGQQQNYGRLFNKNYEEKKNTAELDWVKWGE